MILVLGGIAIATVACVFRDRHASWVERLGAVIGVLAMLDTMVLHDRTVPSVVWIGLLAVLALAAGARLRFATLSGPGRMIALHRALGLVAIAAALAMPESGAAGQGMQMDGEGGPLSIALAYLVVSLAMGVTALRARPSRSAHLGGIHERVHVVNLLEATMMTVMLVVMIVPLASA